MGNLGRSPPKIPERSRNHPPIFVRARLWFGCRCSPRGIGGRYRLITCFFFCLRWVPGQTVLRAGGVSDRSAAVSQGSRTPSWT